MNITIINNLETKKVNHYRYYINNDFSKVSIYAAMSNEELLKSLKGKKVTISINNKEYELSPWFSMSDGQKYIEELSKGVDYKKAISVIIYNKLKHSNIVEYPNLKDIISTNDYNFTDYIHAVVSFEKELETIFHEIDSNLTITERFGVAYKSYMKLLGKRISESMRPIIERPNITQDILKHTGLAYMATIERIQQLNSDWLYKMQDMAKALQPFQQLAYSMAKALSNINIPSISKEQIEQWEENYQKWGEIGWPVLLNSSVNFFGEFPENTKIANKMAMKYCDKNSMEELFDFLRGRNIKLVDLESAVFCYRNSQFKACALMIFCVMESKMIKIQPKNKNRLVGIRAVKELKSQISQEDFLIIQFSNINLMTCLDTYFANGNNFKKEPIAINRNFIAHGMEKRVVRKRDCIQLFHALHNLLEFLDYVS